MRLSSEGLDLIKTFEQFRPTAYKDTGGKETIGYGHLIRGYESWMLHGRIDLVKGLELLQSDSMSAQNCVSREIPEGRLTQNEFDALVSLVFNIGCPAFETSTLVKRLKGYMTNNDIPFIANEFLIWNKVEGRTDKGLIRRRVFERAFFLDKKMDLRAW